MRPTLIPFALLLLATPAPALAQAADTAAIDAQRQAMDRLAAMDGMWRGTAVRYGPDGAHRTTQTERVGTLLDGTIRLVEGRGYDADGSTGFNAFAVIAFDPATQSYSMRSHAQGRAGSFAITPTDDGFVWEIPAGAATIRYTATIGGGKWREIGDYVAAGQPPRRFFEMDLERIGDTDWPGAGAVARE